MSYAWIVGQGSLSATTTKYSIISVNIKNKSIAIFCVFEDNYRTQQSVSCFFFYSL